MGATGYMHNYMRMYWGKKIIEWSNTPETAYRTALDLNNTYFLDGRDANSFSNVAWLFGQHDRGWTERDVFGKVRCMCGRPGAQGQPQGVRREGRAAGARRGAGEPGRPGYLITTRSAGQSARPVRVSSRSWPAAAGRGRPAVASPAASRSAAGRDVGLEPERERPRRRKCKASKKVRVGR